MGKKLLKSSIHYQQMEYTCNSQKFIYPSPSIGCCMITYRAGGVLAAQLTVILAPPVATYGYCPQSGYAPLTGDWVVQDVFVTPTKNLLIRCSETYKIFKLSILSAYANEIAMHVKHT